MSPISDSLRSSSRKSLRGHLSRPAAREVERGLHAYTGQFSTVNNLGEELWSAVYREKLADLMYNLQKARPGMQRLVDQMEESPAHGYNLPFLTAIEVDPDRWDDVTQYIKTTADVLANMPTIQRDPCPQCSCVDYFHEQHQTRGADEPVTNFFTCRDCNHVIMINC